MRASDSGDVEGCKKTCVRYSKCNKYRKTKKTERQEKEKAENERSKRIRLIRYRLIVPFNLYCP